MDTCYDGNLVMPEKFVVMNEDEMTYIGGGNWSLKFKSLDTFWGIPVGAHFTFSGTVADMAWIISAGSVFIAGLAALMMAVPAIGPLLSLKAITAGGLLVAFASTVVATNSRANKSKFSKTFRIGL